MAYRTVSVSEWMDENGVGICEAYRDGRHGYTLYVRRVRTIPVKVLLAMPQDMLFSTDLDAIAALEVALTELGMI